MKIQNVPHSDGFYHTGDHPANGNYVCAQCGGDSVIVPEMVKRLPKCKVCQGTSWMKF